MRGFGYIKDTDSETPLELKEVTIQAEPQTLRDMARFLLDVAEQMETYGKGFDHEHFEDFCSRPKGECRFIVAGNRES